MANRNKKEDTNARKIKPRKRSTAQGAYAKFTNKSKKRNAGKTVYRGQGR